MNRKQYLQTILTDEQIAHGYYLVPTTDNLLEVWHTYNLIGKYCPKVTINQIHLCIQDHMMSREFKQMAGEA